MPLLRDGGDTFRIALCAYDTNAHPEAQTCFSEGGDGPSCQTLKDAQTQLNLGFDSNKALNQFTVPIPARIARCDSVNAQDSAGSPYELALLYAWGTPEVPSVGISQMVTRLLAEEDDSDGNKTNGMMMALKNRYNEAGIDTAPPTCGPAMCVTHFTSEPSLLPKLLTTRLNQLKGQCENTSLGKAPQTKVLASLDLSGGGECPSDVANRVGSSPSVCAPKGTMTDTGDLIDAGSMVAFVLPSDFQLAGPAGERASQSATDLMSKLYQTSNTFLKDFAGNQTTRASLLCGPNATLVDFKVEDGKISASCIDGTAPAAAPAPAPTPAAAPWPWGDWKCLSPDAGSGFAPVRVDGTGTQAECMSTDATNCMWRGTGTECENLIASPPADLSPLLCPPEALSSPGHWCNKTIQEIPPELKVYGNDGSTSCEHYCEGLSGGPWNDELPQSWNGAKCVGHSPDVPDCSSGFTKGPSSYCLCQKTGSGWS